MMGIEDGTTIRTHRNQFDQVGWQGIDLKSRRGCDLPISRISRFGPIGGLGYPIP